VFYSALESDLSNVLQVLSMPTGPEYWSLE